MIVVVSDTTISAALLGQTHVNYSGWTHYVGSPTIELPSREDFSSYLVGPYVRMPYSTLPGMQ
jgi:hypothetical protein